MPIEREVKNPMSRRHDRSCIVVVVVVVVIAALGGGCSSPDVDACCACLVGTAADGTATTDADANCLADDNASGSFDDESEKCPSSMGLGVALGGDNATSVGLKADGCREACFEACTVVDPQIAFDTPVISAGTLTATVGGVAEEATMVTTNKGPNQDAFIVNISATTAIGQWNLLLGRMPPGAGRYPFAPFTDFGMTASSAGTVTGTFDVTTFDERHIEGTFSGVIEGGPGGPAVAVAVEGTYTADFTVNDGEVSGLLGLQ
jgi:hypothetical protein